VFDLKFRREETFSYTVRSVNCPVCERIISGGRRKARRPRTLVQ